MLSDARLMGSYTAQGSRPGTIGTKATNGMGAVHKLALTFGLLLIAVGAFVLSQGSQSLDLAAETFGLATRTETTRPLIAQTLLTVPASNSTFLSADLSAGTKVKGSLQVVDEKEIALYVLDEGNFTFWRAGKPSNVVLAKPVAASYNFTLIPLTSDTYYFIFDNHDTARRTIIFSLSVQEASLAVNPLVGYAGYELIALGLIVIMLGAKGPRKKHEQETLKQGHFSCRFCGVALESGKVFCGSCGRAQE